MLQRLAIDTTGEHGGVSYYHRMYLPTTAHVVFGRLMDDLGEVQVPFSEPPNCPDHAKVMPESSGGRHDIFPGIRDLF